jgi:Raf kinase inhibitor-like YbhB/YbcL family protein
VSKSFLKFGKKKRMRLPCPTRLNFLSKIKLLGRIETKPAMGTFRNPDRLKNMRFMKIRTIIFSIFSILGVPFMAHSIQLTSSSFEHLKTIPVTFTCKGENISPELTWTPGPKDTKSFAMTCIDYDAPSGRVVHWIIFNISPEIHHLKEGIKEDVFFLQGANHSQKNSYTGPCPPPGKAHQYKFTIYALNEMLELPSGASIDAFEKAIQTHVLEQTQLIGLFSTK